MLACDIACKDVIFDEVKQAFKVCYKCQCKKLKRKEFKIGKNQMINH